VNWTSQSCLLLNHETFWKSVVILSRTSRPKLHRILIRKSERPCSIADNVKLHWYHFSNDAASNSSYEAYIWRYNKCRLFVYRKQISWDQCSEYRILVNTVSPKNSLHCMYSDFIKFALIFFIRFEVYSCFGQIPIIQKPVLTKISLSFLCAAELFVTWHPFNLHVALWISRLC